PGRRAAAAGDAGLRMVREKPCRVSAGEATALRSGGAAPSPLRRTARLGTGPHIDAFAADADAPDAERDPVPQPYDRDARSNGQVPAPRLPSRRKMATSLPATARPR